MLTEETFRAWCQRNQITRETETYIQRIRASQPVRKVRSGVSNVTGRYPSVKMGCSMQFESQYVELWGMYTMERDDDVLEYFDQPTRIQLHYQARSGRKTSPWHTPDFFVVRRDGAGFEEWKPAASLEQLGRRMPARYQRHGAGGWQCPPGEAAANPLGLYYRVRTSAEYHPFYIQNLKFLQDFWTHSFHVDAGQEAQVLEALSAYPGVSVAALLDAHPHLPVDVVWALVTSQQIFTDLAAADLMRWDQVFLYQSAAEARAASRLAAQGRHALPLTARVLWDGRLWEAEGSCPSILRVIPSPANQVKYPHFTTCVRGLCRGITPLFLPADVPGTPLVLRHAVLCLAKRVYRRGSEAIQASAATAQALQRPEAVSWSHPQAPLCRL